MAVAGSLLSLDDVERARERVGARLHYTPVHSSQTLSTQVGANVQFKCELFQRTGSFKPRGVLNKLSQLTSAEKARGLISISAGNHAQALAYAASLERLDALVVMWQTASPMKVAAARSYGATIDTSAPDKTAAFVHLERLIEETGRTLVHPYDDPLVIAGQGTVGLELLEQVPDADVVLVQVGGGGLVSGIATAVKGVKPQARVIAVEPEQSCALHEGLRAGRPVTVPGESIADGLAGPYVGTNCLDVCTAFGVESVLLTEDELAAGFRFMYGRMKLACEVAGAATAAALLAGKVEVERGSTVVGIVSGGNVAPKTAAAILAANEG